MKKTKEQLLNENEMLTNRVYAQMRAMEQLRAFLILILMMDEDGSHHTNADLRDLLLKIKAFLEQSTP